MQQLDCDVVIIGAGPAGSIAAAMLANAGWQVTVVERERFPRFSIGESLLPQCMQYLQKAGMQQAVIDNAAQLGFQFKNGAAFYRKGQHSAFDFTQKFSEGPGTTFQVKRAAFDHLLAQEAEKAGANMLFEHSVTAFSAEDGAVKVFVDSVKGAGQINAKFALDASGFGRVLPRLLKLDCATEMQTRRAVFTHVQDNMPDDVNFDRNKILVSVHPEMKDLWFWFIPFSDGTASIGAVARPEYFDDALTLEQQLMDWHHQDAHLSHLLGQAEILQPARTIGGYSANVKSMHGAGFALLGNAGEFLDPVFSSGVTIAMHSAVLAAEVLNRQLQGEQVDWQNDYQVPLKKGIDVFKVFVHAWYDTSLQDVIFFSDASEEVRAMVASILAGYAWDQGNPFVKNTAKGIGVLTKLCAEN